MSRVDPSFPIVVRNVIEPPGAKLDYDLPDDPDSRRPERPLARKRQISVGCYDDGIAARRLAGGLCPEVLFNPSGLVPSSVVVFGRSGKAKTLAKAD